MTIITRVSRADIEQDIEGFETRIAGIRKKLFELPSGGTGKQTWKVNNTRRKLLQELVHVRGLIALAEEVLKEPVTNGTKKSNNETKPVTYEPQEINDN